MEEKKIIQQFKAATLEPSLFNHEAHLHLAYLYIQKFGLEKAIDEICQDLKNYVKQVGAENKYHHTLTVAAIQIVNHFMQKSNSNNFHDFIHEFPRLKTSFKELIQQHYSFDIFQNEMSKEKFLEPDLIPF